ncbi:SRPBCC family protein [Chryseolinea lacunae]|uniref:SRPBCC domain-containing protein n=1 Tax=Chryseolinea lacunae TaxID=2801331 RepID=A0ABS1L0K1_9BACT|nr:SRPBCC domain-containing protein [Chryseolinea lacunae]MBL0745225.1 SRPBCC domain-containing protein [Chryseolinea lacunae]
MATKDFTTTLLVDNTPLEAFNAITNVRGWWSEDVEGNTNKLNEAFNYQYEDIHRCQIKVVELVPEKKVGWLVKNNFFKFTKDSSEWTGTTITFEISQKENKTQIVFTHIGLVPEYECYDVCRDGWTQYIQKSLKALITTGKGLPNGKSKPPRTKHEEKFLTRS